MRKRALFVWMILMVLAFTGKAFGGSEGILNTFYGNVAGANTTGDDDYDTFIGASAGYSNTTGNYNSFLGVGAGYSNTTGNYNSFLGAGAGYTNTTGNYNSFLGAGAGYSNTTGYENTFLGRRAGYTNTTGSFNTFVGQHAGYSNTTGYYNTFLGRGAGYTNTTGNWNAFLGYGAGNVNTTGYTNTFVGTVAGINNTDGYENAFFGGWAGYSNTTGYWNVFLGPGAGYFHTTGYANVFVGTGAGYSHTTGDINTFIGSGAGYSNTTGSVNVFLGRRAGYYNETDSNKLYIANSETDTPLIYGEFDNRTMTINGNLKVVGPNNGLIYLTDITTDNTRKEAGLVLNHYSNVELPIYLLGAIARAGDNVVKLGGGNDLGNAATKIVFFTAPNTINKGGKARLTIQGNGYIGIGTKDPNYPLDMDSGAYVTTGGVWTDASSREYKDNIEALATQEALDTLQALNPVKFAYKADRSERHVGFIAEEVPELIATKDRKGLSAMDIVAVLTKVVQEQQEAIQEQEKTIQELSDKVIGLERELKHR